MASPDPADGWIFAYASLIWRPGFTFAEARPAVLAGYARDMCFLSIHYRGTSERPGLVCGLMPAPGASCKGSAYRIAGPELAAVVAYLDARELISHIYIPCTLEITLEGGSVVTARTYVADTVHEQFVGGWTDDEKAAAIARGVGSEGRSLDYLASLVEHLDGLGISDPHMTRLLAKARAADEI